MSQVEGEIIATDVTPCHKVFIRSKLLCNGEKNQDKKLECKSSSQFSSSHGMTSMEILLQYLVLWDTLVDITLHQGV
jgi:hypothetical protein